MYVHTYVFLDVYTYFEMISNWNSHSGTALPMILQSLIQTELVNIKNFMP